MARGIWKCVHGGHGSMAVVERLGGWKCHSDGGGGRMYCVLGREVAAEMDLLYGELMDEFWSAPLSPSMNSWTLFIIFSLLTH